MATSDVQTAAMVQPRGAGPATSVTSVRMAWLDVAKGIAIILVVIGHAFGGLIDAHLPQLWLRYGILAIYTFHMPLFFFLAGYLVDGRLRRSPDRFQRSVVTKIIYPYFLWSIVQMVAISLIGKLANHPTEPFHAFQVVRLLWFPGGQFWFLYALFFMHVASILVYPRMGAPAFAITAFALKAAAEALGLRGVAGLVISFFPYYCLGVAAGGDPDLLCQSDRWRRSSVYLLAALSFMLLLGTVVMVVRGMGADRLFSATADVLEGATRGMIAVSVALAMGATILLASRRPPLVSSRPLDYLGRMTMPIFVLHVMVIAGLRILLMRFLGINDPLFLVPILVVAGLGLPVLAFEVLRRLRLAVPLGLA